MNELFEFTNEQIEILDHIDHNSKLLVTEPKELAKLLLLRKLLRRSQKKK